MRLLSTQWRGRRWRRVVLGRKFHLAVPLILRWGASQLVPIPPPSNLSHMVLAYLPPQLSLHPSSPHHGFLFIKLHSLARCLPPTGWFVEVAKCWELWFLSGLPQCPLPSSWQQRAARCRIALSGLWNFVCVSPNMIVTIYDFRAYWPCNLVCMSNKWENRKLSGYRNR